MQVRVRHVCISSCVCVQGYLRSVAVEGTEGGAGLALSNMFCYGKRTEWGPRPRSQPYRAVPTTPTGPRPSAPPRPPDWRCWCGCCLSTRTRRLRQATAPARTTPTPPTSQSSRDTLTSYTDSSRPLVTCPGPRIPSLLSPGLLPARLYGGTAAGAADAYGADRQERRVVQVGVLLANRQLHRAVGQGRGANGDAC